MKLIIDIDEDVRVAITRMGLLRIPDEMQEKVDKAIQYGTPLPKRHGRIIDESQITEVYTRTTKERSVNGIIIVPRIEFIGTNARTIIKAD